MALLFGKVYLNKTLDFLILIKCVRNIVISLMEISYDGFGLTKIQFTLWGKIVFSIVF